jgi:hypothetical protein
MFRTRRPGGIKRVAGLYQRQKNPLNHSKRIRRRP